MPRSSSIPAEGKNLNAFFTVNLRGETTTQTFDEIVHPRGFLISSDYLKGALIKTTRQKISSGSHVIIDNGNFDEIGKISTDLSQPAEELKKNFLRLKKKKSIHEEDFPPELRDQITDISKSIEKEILDHFGNKKLDLSGSLAYNPSGVIGIEDITAALWLRLGLEIQYIPNGREALRKKNETVCETAVTEIGTLKKSWNGRYLTVASALDYDSAFDAGSAFASREIEHAAIGFGAFMSDDSFQDYVIINGKRIDLPSLAPMRYLRCALVVRGFWDGYNSQKKTSLKSFHFLGLGTPVMIPILALGAYSTKFQTYDATSPFKDAFQGILYTLEPAYFKRRATSIAFGLASNPTAPWSCPCKFCKDFEKQYPMDYKKGYEWYKSKKPSKVEMKDLHPGGSLFDVYPFLSEPESGSRRKMINLCRMGHNHWIYERIFEGLRDNNSNRDSFEKHVEGIVNRYLQNSKWDQAAHSVKLAFEIVKAESVNDVLKSIG